MPSLYPDLLPSPSATYHTRAKLNLFLHVTGRLPNGYHSLQSLAVFPMIGDIIQWQLLDEARPEGPVSYGGPFGPALIESLAQTDSQDRLWPLLRDLWQGSQDAPIPPLWIHLDKRLPIASGMGGGSGDFAAMGRLVRAFLPESLEIRRRAEALIEEALVSYGADVPVCWHQRAAMMEGIGEKLSFIEELPGFDVLLVTLPIACHTPDFFRALPSFRSPMAELPLRWNSLKALVSWLKEACGNDFEPLATARHPDIARVLEALRGSEGCLFARMSGSGPSCFGIYEDRLALVEAARRMQEEWPASWVRVAPVPAVESGKECAA